MILCSISDLICLKNPVFVFFSDLLIKTAQKGRQEGMELLLKVLKEKADLDLISKGAGLSKEEIKKIQNSYINPEAFILFIKAELGRVLINIKSCSKKSKNFF